MFKKIVIAASVASLVSTTALAGGMAEPVMEPEVIAEESEGSAGGWVVPLLLIAVVAAVAASSGSSDVPAEGGGGMMNASDLRLKTDVLRVGTTDSGLPLYQFRYAGLPTTYEGVMAQDVLPHAPEAISLIGDTQYMAVNYEMLGLEMKIID